MRANRNHQYSSRTCYELEIERTTTDFGSHSYSQSNLNVSKKLLTLLKADIVKHQIVRYPGAVWFHRK